MELTVHMLLFMLQHTYLILWFLTSSLSNSTCFQARLDILKIHSRKMNLTRGINLRKIAEMMPGASGAEVKVSRGCGLDTNQTVPYISMNLGAGEIILDKQPKTKAPCFVTFFGI